MLAAARSHCQQRHQVRGPACCCDPSLGYHRSPECAERAHVLSTWLVMHGNNVAQAPSGRDALSGSGLGQAVERLGVLALF